jgi:GNAT superfamily N-acetyltransferase
VLQLREQRWYKIDAFQKTYPENFLRLNEPFCVSACSSFMNMSDSADKVWVLTGGAMHQVSAVLFQHGKTLFPVFGNNIDIKIPVFLSRVFSAAPIRSIQGLAWDTQILENILSTAGVFAQERVEFDLMNIDSLSELTKVKKPSLPIEFHIPEACEADEIFKLHAAYELEEVLPRGAKFNPSLCRLQVEHILKKQKILVVNKGNRMIAKINTNAISYSRYQIGGVYVLPEFRGCGIGSAMTSLFAHILLSEGHGVTLFVKKKNPPARQVYKKAGFKKTADYRIVYLAPDTL